MPSEIIANLISSVIGGLIVAIANWLLTRRKTEAEVAKLTAEADKIKVETEKIKSEMRTEISKLSNVVEEVNYYSLPSSEKIIYDGTRGIEGYDVTGHADIRSGILVSLNGRYALRKYICDGKEMTFMPKNEILAIRKLRVSFEAKVTQGKYVLVFLFREHLEEKILEGREVEIDKADWTRTDLYFRLPSDRDCFLGFDCFSHPSEQQNLGSLQLRNLVVAERSSSE